MNIPGPFYLILKLYSVIIKTCPVVNSRLLRSSKINLKLVENLLQGYEKGGGIVEKNRRKNQNAREKETTENESFGKKCFWT